MVPRAYSFALPRAISLLTRTRYGVLSRPVDQESSAKPVSIKTKKVAPSSVGAINRDGGSCDVCGALIGDPKNEIGHIGRLQPLRKIRSGHGLTVRGRVHRAGKNHISGESRVLVFQRHRANQTHQRGLECYVGPKAGMRLDGRKAGEGADAAGA